MDDSTKLFTLRTTSEKVENLAGILTIDDDMKFAETLLEIVRSRKVNCESRSYIYVQSWSIFQLNYPDRRKCLANLLQYAIDCKHIRMQDIREAFEKSGNLQGLKEWEQMLRDLDPKSKATE